MQKLLRLVYPPQCVSCGDLIGPDGALCGPCWLATPFISGLACDLCGHPLPGAAGTTAEHCDDCLVIARPWARGRAALAYRDNGRRLVLSLKRADRTEIVPSAARWMADACRTLLGSGPVVVPVPMHWTRLVRRRQSPAALLAREVARQAGLEYLPDGLLRIRRTPLQDGKSRDARFINLSGAIAPHPRRGACLSDRDVLLVDDVMSSGATFAAAADAAHAAGAREVSILALARAVRDDYM